MNNAIRQDRLRSGAPLLVGHDTADQVGVVDSYEITADKKLRILARLRRSDRAEEIFRDVLDSIRCNASVGYLTHGRITGSCSEAPPARRRARSALRAGCRGPIHHSSKDRHGRE